TSYHPRVLRGKYEFKKDGTESMFSDFNKDDLKKVRPGPDYDHMDDAHAFYACYADAIGQLCNDMFQFTERLSLVKAKFNPIAIWKAEDERKRRARGDLLEPNDMLLP